MIGHLSSKESVMKMQPLSAFEAKYDAVMTTHQKDGVGEEQ